MVSRSLAACEGALLVVDASQGIQAQTLANVYLALENDLEIIPVINKIDLDVAEPERVAEEVKQAFGFIDDEIVFVSAKDGTGIPEILEAIVERVPPPTGSVDSPLRALIFDSKYDPYKGAIAYVRVMDGQAPSGSRVKIMSTASASDALEVGVFTPEPTSIDRLTVGEVGYIATGLKSVGDAPVGDTVTLANGGAAEPLKGYQPLKPMVFAGLVPRRRRGLPRYARRAGEVAAQRCRPELPARELAGARLRLSLRLPGAAAHGYCARAA